MSDREVLDKRPIVDDPHFQEQQSNSGEADQDPTGQRAATDQLLGGGWFQPRRVQDQGHCPAEEVWDKLLGGKCLKPVGGRDQDHYHGG